jgi:FkbM family methyltransferase
MIEPSAERVRALQELCRHDLQLRVEQALLGSRDQEVFFREDESNSGVVLTPDAKSVSMACSPLDMLVPGSPFAAPELLKIDAQGYDLEVLKGAVETLHTVQVIVLELSLIPLNPCAPSIREAVDWLDDRGFRLLDICGFMRRPVDGALFQIDAAFARKDSELGSVRLGWA